LGANFSAALNDSTYGHGFWIFDKSPGKILLKEILKLRIGIFLQ